MAAANCRTTPHVATDMPVPVYHRYGSSQQPQTHSGAAGKIAGGLGAAYAAHKLRDKLTRFQRLALY